MWNKIIEIEKTDVGAILKLDPDYLEYCTDDEKNMYNIIDDLEWADIYPVYINDLIYFMDYNRNVLMQSEEPYLEYANNWIEKIFNILKTEGSSKLFNVDNPDELLSELEKSYDY